MADGTADADEADLGEAIHVFAEGQSEYPACECESAQYDVSGGRSVMVGAGVAVLPVWTELVHATWGDVEEGDARGELSGQRGDEAG